MVINNTTKIMLKSILVLLFITIVFVSSQPPPPNEPNDFSSSVYLTERNRDHERQFIGQLYEDFTNTRQRIDVKRSETNAVIRFYRFYATKVEYEYFEDSKKCNKQSFNGTFHPAFDWVKTAHYAGECYSRHDQGQQKGDYWKEHGTDVNFHRHLCIAANSTQTPFWLEQHHGHFSRQIEFVIFTSGTPDKSLFVLPPECGTTIPNQKFY